MKGCHSGPKLLGATTDRMCVRTYTGGGGVVCVRTRKKLIKYQKITTTKNKKNIDW